MRLDSEQLAQHLKRGLQSLYTVYGDEPLLALEAADRIRAHARTQGYSEREIVIIESAADWAQLNASGSSLSLFGSRRLMDLRIPSGKPGTEGAESLKRYAADLPPDTLTLISLPRLERAVLNSGWFEALDRAGVSVAANTVPLARLPQWLAGRLADQAQEADHDTLQFLAEMVEGNLLAARQEVQKLALLFPAGPLDGAAVRAAVSDVARYDVFKIGEPLLGGDRARFVRVLGALQAEGAAAPLVLWAITEEIHALWRVSALIESGRPLQQALREARVWGARAELLPQALRRVRRDQLQAALLQAAQADRVIKGIGPGDPWDELLRLGMALAGLPQGSAQGNRGRIRA